MRTKSKKRSEREAEAKPFRDDLIKRVGECECCGRSPSDRAGRMAEQAQLCVHEIANGPNRQKALDKPYAVLVACWGCNGQELEDKGEYPESRQLALLAKSRPGDFDLTAYLELTSPKAIKRIEIHEVLDWMTEDYLTKADVAARVQVDRRAVQNWIEAGELPAMDARTVGATKPLYRIPWEGYLDFCRRRAVTTD